MHARMGEGGVQNHSSLDPPPPLKKSNLFNLCAVVQLPKLYPLANLNILPLSTREIFWIRAHMPFAHRRLIDQLFVTEFNYELVIHVYILFVAHLGCNNRKVIYVIN